MRDSPLDSVATKLTQTDLSRTGPSTAWVSTSILETLMTLFATSITAASGCVRLGSGSFEMIRRRRCPTGRAGWRSRGSRSSPKLQAWFSGFDDSVPADQRIRPGAFGLIGHPLGLITGTSQTRPARSYEPDPARWDQGPWYDRRTGAEIAVTALSAAEDPERFSCALASGAVRLQTLADVLARYRLHPEHKSLAPNGTWADEETRGLLQRRPVSSAPVLTA